MERTREQSERTQKQINWTREQNAVIKAPFDANLLVPASAGAGKTSVMIERIADMIKSGISWDRFLVMTFTKESARDMKQKLMDKLGAKYQTIVGQISIGTFHKFCEDLIKTHFSVVGVNPSFAILDDDSAFAIQNTILDAVIDENLSKYPNVIDAFCTPASSQGLKDIIRETAKFLEWQDENWLSEHAFAGYAEDLSKNIALDIIVRHYRQAGEYYLKKFPVEMDCHMWTRRLASVTGYEDLHNIAVTFDGLKRMSKDSEFYAAKDGLNELLKDKISKQYTLSQQQIIKNQAADRKLVEGVLIYMKDYIGRYNAAKAERNFLDFADLEKSAAAVLANDSVRSSVNAKYEYIFVDEYQDTNPVQEKILGLAAGSGKIFTVGDIKQSIYAFRGTSAAVFTNRLQLYENAENSQVIYLNENFRSDNNILKFVNRVFEKIMRQGTAGLDYGTTSRFTVKDIPETECAETVVIKYGTAEHEARYITARIAEMLANGTRPEQIAILARERKNFDLLIKNLSSVGIKCTADKTVPAESLYEIALLNNMLAACLDPTYELPRALLMQSFVFNFSANDLAKIKLGKVDGDLQSRLDVFNAFIEKYHQLCQTRTAADVLEMFIAEYNIINLLLITPDGETRVRNIYTFLNKLRGAGYADTVPQYIYMLQNEMLDIKIAVSAAVGSVRLMTVHSSKGLEFPIVFLYNAGEPFSIKDKQKKIMLDKTCGMCVFSTIPDENKKHISLARLGASVAVTRGQIAEEMRLLYVALTRAKDRLVIIGSGHSYENTELDDFEILSARNYLDFIRPTDTIDVEDIPAPAAKQEQQFLNAKPDKKLTAELRARFEKSEDYKYKSVADSPMKTSVTALTSVGERKPSFVSKKLDIIEAESSDDTDTSHGTEYGTKFHAAMQTGNYFDDATRKCAEIVDAFTQGLKVYRELIVMTTVGDSLVQGVIDLLAVGNGRAVLIDYKTTRAPRQKLIQLYKPQLDMYAAAVEKAIGQKPETYIYSSVLQELVPV